MWDWLSTNKEWFLSGLGITILSAIAWVIKRSFSSQGGEAKQYQKSGAFSKNIQVGDVTIGRSEQDK